MFVLVTMVVVTQAVEVPHRGRAARLDGQVVVDLEVTIDVTPSDRALSLAFLHRSAQPSGNQPTQV